MTTVECVYCGSHIREKNLKRHQSSTKYCLEKQGKVIKYTYNCIMCSFGSNLASDVKRHQITCKKISKKITKDSRSALKEYKKKIKALKLDVKNLKKQNQDYKDKTALLREENAAFLQKYDDLEIKYEELRDDYHNLRENLAKDEGKIEILEKVVDKPRTTNNYIQSKLLTVPVQNIHPLTIENVRKRIEGGGYTYEMFVNGIRGLTEFVSGMIIDDKKAALMTTRDDDDDAEDNNPAPERNYVCTDTSRNKFHRLLESKDWKADNGAQFLAKILTELTPNANEYYHRIIDMMKDPEIDEEDREYADRLLRLTRDVYFGITRPTSSEREALFKKLRSKIKGIAAI